MPSFTFIPAQMELAPGNIGFIPERFAFTPARMVLTGGTVEMGPGLEGTLTASDVKLDRWQRQFPMVDRNGTPTPQFHAFLQEFADTIELAFADQGEQIGENTRLLQLISLALGIAESANATAQAVQSAQALQNSYTDPVAVLSATAAGGIAISSHDRIYGDGTRVSVTAGTLNGFANGVNVTVYYNDPAREGGAVSYQGTTSAVAQTGSTHIVGQVTIPALGEPNAPGVGPTAPGYTPPEGGYGPGNGDYILQ